MKKPRALDLFCKAGGATRGLQLAGFVVHGIDIEPQPHYCGEQFTQADALTFGTYEWFRQFDLIWASPPCQRYSLLAYRNGNAASHPDLIGPIRERLVATGVPYIIENVVGAASKLIHPILLCGTMFDLGIDNADLWRHRLFESSLPLAVTRSCRHRKAVIGVYGGGGDKRRFGVCTVTGHTGGTRKRGNLQQYNVAQRSQAMGIDWMTNDELSQAIPPAYSRFLGAQVLFQIRATSHEVLASVQSREEQRAAGAGSQG